MRSIIHRKRPVALAIAGFSLASVVACGGGSNEPNIVSGGGTTSPAPAPAPAPAPITTTDLKVRVIDGPIGNATVCLDKNSNSACDTGEPAGKTDSSGQVTLVVENADLNRFPVLAVVGTDAVDADFGAITVPFVMSTTPDKPSLVSPLTTLVRTQSGAGQQSTADAERFVQSQLGVSASMFTDYTLGSGDDNSKAATIARLAVLTGQQQSTVIGGALGKTDITGSTITQADITAAVQRAVLDVMQDLAAAATDPAIAGAADRTTALQASATSIVSNQSALNAGNAVQTIGVSKLIAQDVAASTSASAPKPVPAAGASLRMFQYTDASNWVYRGFLSTLADATPDANNVVRYYEQRSRNTAGNIVTTGWQSDPARANETFWNGTAWITCPYGTRGTNQFLDASGTTRLGVYCNGYLTSFARRANQDISGQTMTSVIEQIRQLPSSDAGVAYAQFGPANLTVLGSEKFPAGSLLQYQDSQDTAPRAFAYDSRASNTLFQVNADVAAGGSSSAIPQPPCGQITTSTPSTAYQSPATSLDSLVASYNGTPCRYLPGTDSNGSSGPRNEWWGNSTVSVGTLANAAVRPANTGNYYQTSAAIRIGFTGPGTVTYYQCLLRTLGGSPRNCDPIGTGTYSITTLGDGRVLSITNPPAITAGLTYERVFVERAGGIYPGYRSKAAGGQVAQLNGTAANALFTLLGVPLMAPQ